MKNLYEITNKAGRVLCYQVAGSASDAVDFARAYGHRSAFSASFVREH